MGRQRPLALGAADRLAAELDALAGMDAVALARRWRQVFGRMPPDALSPTLRARLIAYRLQALALGDLDREICQALDRAAPRSGQGTGRPGEPILVPIPDQRARTPGTVLAREWGGAMHQVMVSEAGYVWSGAIYDSLSKVAHAITGTKWNGPRFFGLCAKGGGRSDARAGRAGA